MKLACISLLSTLLKHDWNDWLAQIQEHQLQLFCQQRFSDMQGLINPELPHSSSKYTLPCALASASILSLIQWKHHINLSELDRTAHTTSLVENVIQFVFPSQREAHQARGPQWTTDGQNEASRSYALDLLYCWYLCGGETWSVFSKQESQWGSYVQSFWMDLIANRNQDLHRTLPVIFQLSTSCRTSMKGMLFSSIQRHMGSGHDMTKICHRILSSLFGIFINVSRTSGSVQFMNKLVY